MMPFKIGQKCSIKGYDDCRIVDGYKYKGKWRLLLTYKTVRGVKYYVEKDLDEVTFTL